MLWNGVYQLFKTLPSLCHTRPQPVEIRGASPSQIDHHKFGDFIGVQGQIFSSQFFQSGSGRLDQADHFGGDLHPPLPPVHRLGAWKQVNTGRQFLLNQHRGNSPGNLRGGERHEDNYRITHSNRFRAQRGATAPASVPPACLSCSVIPRAIQPPPTTASPR